MGTFYRDRGFLALMTNETTTIKGEAVILTGPPKGKRRTAAEVKADLQARIKAIEERQAGEVLRLVSDAYDTLKEAMSLEAAKPHVTTLTNVLKALDPVVAQRPK